MIAKFIIKREVVRGECVVRLINWENVLSEYKLPLPYIKSGDYFYETEGGVYVSKEFTLLEETALESNKSYNFLKKNDLYSLEEWERIVTFLRQCGERLVSIQKEIVKKKNAWKETYTYQI